MLAWQTNSRSPISVSGKYKIYSKQKFTLLVNKTEAIKIKLFPEEDSGEDMVLNRRCSQQPVTVTFPESGCIESQKLNSQSWILPYPTLYTKYWQTSFLYTSFNYSTSDTRTTAMLQLVMTLQAVPLCADWPWQTLVPEGPRKKKFHS